MTQVAYKDLKVWQKSIDLATAVIALVDDLNTERKHFRLIEQLEAAVTSIPMNIAEGMQSTPSGKADHQKKNLSISYILLEVPFTKH